MLKDQSYPKSKRLCKSAEFQAVFTQAQRVSGLGFVFFIKRNPQLTARLGIAVSKRIFRKANQRNRIKRLLRNYFRLHCQGLAAIDLVISAKPSILEMTNAEINQLLEQQWLKLVKYCATLSFS